MSRERPEDSDSLTPRSPRDDAPNDQPAAFESYEARAPQARRQRIDMEAELNQPVLPSNALLVGDKETPQVQSTSTGGTRSSLQLHEWDRPETEPPGDGSSCQNEGRLLETRTSRLRESAAMPLQPQLATTTTPLPTEPSRLPSPTPAPRSPSPLPRLPSQADPIRPPSCTSADVLSFAGRCLDIGAGMRQADLLCWRTGERQGALPLRALLVRLEDVQAPQLPAAPEDTMLCVAALTEPSVFLVALPKAGHYAMVPQALKKYPGPWQKATIAMKNAKQAVAATNTAAPDTEVRRIIPMSFIVRTDRAGRATREHDVDFLRRAWLMPTAADAGVRLAAKADLLRSRAAASVVAINPVGLGFLMGGSVNAPGWRQLAGTGPHGTYRPAPSGESTGPPGEAPTIGNELGTRSAPTSSNDSAAAGQAAELTAPTEVVPMVTPEEFARVPEHFYRTLTLSEYDRLLQGTPAAAMRESAAVTQTTAHYNTTDAVPANVRQQTVLALSDPSFRIDPSNDVVHAQFTQASVDVDMWGVQGRLCWTTDAAASLAASLDETRDQRSTRVSTRRQILSFYPRR
jgi:hypothetical protein